MAIEEAVTEFARWLEQRNAQQETRLKAAGSDVQRSRVQTELAELHFIQAKFREFVIRHFEVEKA